MYKFYLLFSCLIFSVSCSDGIKNPSDFFLSKDNKNLEKFKIPILDIDEIDKIAQLPLECVNVEYPNKLSQTIGSSNDLKAPKELHPAFYGCFDWHSAVHGHWSMVSFLKHYPKVKSADILRSVLVDHITEENINQELVYFNNKINKGWERTYGWAWLLKLGEELHTWDDPLAKKLESNLKPLTDLISSRLESFLPKLRYPIRVGTHTNTAFGLAFAYDYAVVTENQSLKDIIKIRAIEFYMEDKGCPINWEPGGYDFLSPCLEEMDLMRRVLDEESFKTWLVNFLPELSDKNYHLDVGEVSDRSDGHLVHLDGVNFSRAWCLYGLSNQYSEYEHLKNIANEHMIYSLPNLVGDGYEGGHWLGSFAIYALISSKE